MYRVYGMATSGNCYKVRLLLEQTGTPYTWQETNLLAGETRQPGFLAMNPNGKVPLLEIAPGRYLAESNAILHYLADDTALLPADRYRHAQVLQWMFFEQYSHEPCVAVAIFICRFLANDHPRRAELPRLHERGYQALAVMDSHLSRHDYFVGSDYTIADIALFAYTHRAAIGGFDLSRFDAVGAWIERIRACPGFVDMD